MDDKNRGKKKEDEKRKIKQIKKLWILIFINGDGGGVLLLYCYF